MITVSQIKDLFEQWQKDENIFLVDVSIMPGNKITALIDSLQGLNISNCVDFSRFIEGNLDREKEDYELSVSSPGADSPFKVLKQYQKNIGRKIKLVTKDDQTVSGTLLKLIENSVEIAPDSNKKNKTNITSSFDINNIKEIRVIISFK
jgi:ribosome maturation factor RimP